MVFPGLRKRSISMATQIVMDHTGDTRHYFDTDDTEALLKAEERFKALLPQALRRLFAMPPAMSL
jgi:hypothetical protein